jgi:hypothetical protein
MMTAVLAEARDFVRDWPETPAPAQMERDSYAAPSLDR